MRIGELARAVGVSVRSLRYYEEQGLLRSTRTAGGQRVYDEAEVQRAALVKRLLAAGLSSRTIAEVMPCVDRPSVETADAATERMALERARLTEHIDELVRTRDHLDALIAANRAYRQGLTRAAV
jgi:DNA-binding transcriptional MerR regulator